MFSSETPLVEGLDDVEAQPPVLIDSQAISSCYPRVLLRSCRRPGIGSLENLKEAVGGMVTGQSASPSANWRKGRICRDRKRRVQLTCAHMDRFTLRSWCRFSSNDTAITSVPDNTECSLNGLAAPKGLFGC